MRILWVDIDSLRPDHLGCYGYSRNTSPTIDRIAADAARLTRCYTSDAPCLPSRSALQFGRPGIATGVVNHGGTASQPFPDGPNRKFSGTRDRRTLFAQLRDAGFHTVGITPFPTRHGAWHFLEGLREWHDPKGFGNETADQVNPLALDWLSRHGRDDHWFCYVNYWDPHRPYRTPESFGNPFKDDPPPAWYTEQIRATHWRGTGMQCAQDPNDGSDNHANYPRMPRQIASMDDYDRWIDGYDCGIRYADDHLGELIALMESQGVLNDTAIVITADHGENQGELNHYGSHRTGDHATHHVPMIMRWPGLTDGGRVIGGLHYHFDAGATLLELLDIPQPKAWHAESFAAALHGEPSCRDHLVFGQLACMAQRSVRFENWLVMRTWHTGFTGFPDVMLYDIEADPHETTDLSAQHADVVAKGLALLDAWTEANVTDQGDPLETVLREKPHHANAEEWARYGPRLRATGRGAQADALEARDFCHEHTAR